MMKQWLIIIVLCLGNQLLICQTKIFNNWHFGDHANITFNTVPPSYTMRPLQN